MLPGTLTHRAPPPTQDYLAQKCQIGEVEKPCLGCLGAGWEESGPVSHRRGLSYGVRGQTWVETGVKLERSELWGERTLGRKGKRFGAPLEVRGDGSRCSWSGFRWRHDRLVGTIVVFCSVSHGRENHTVLGSCI